MLSASSRCLKYLMFIFNFFVVIIGIVLLILGVGTYGVYSDYQEFLDPSFLSVPILVIVIGAVVFFIAFFGCCGAVRENYCMLMTFACLLVMIFILELSGGISGYVLRSHADQTIRGKMIGSMKQYNESKEVTFLWDTIQRELHCCGAVNSTDWEVHGNGEFHGNFPLSCCNDDAGQNRLFNCTVDRPDRYLNGCYKQFLDVVKFYAHQLGGFGLGVALVQAIGIWLSICLARSIRNSYESV